MGSEMCIRDRTEVECSGFRNCGKEVVEIQFKISQLTIKGVSTSRFDSAVEFKIGRQPICIDTEIESAIFEFPLGVILHDLNVISGGIHTESVQNIEGSSGLTGDVHSLKKCLRICRNVGNKLFLVEG